MGGTGACPLVGVADSHLSGGWGFVWVRFKVGMCLGGPLGSLFADWWACDPWIFFRFLFGLGLLSTDEWGQIFPKWPPLEENIMMIIPKTFASNVLPPQQDTFTPCFPRRSFKNCSQVWSRFLWSLCFALGLSAQWKPVCDFQERNLFPPVPWSSCSTSPAGPQCKILQELLLPMSDLQFGDLTWGSKLFTPVGEPLWYKLLSSLWVTQPESIGLLILSSRPSYCLNMAFSLSFEVQYLFWSFSVYFAQGCSAVGCNFVVFMRGELQSF